MARGDVVTGQRQVAVVAASPGRAVRPEGAYGLRALGSVIEQLQGPAQRIYSKAMQQEAKRAEREGANAGAVYGTETALADIQLPTGDSIGEEAFRRSAVVAAGAQAEMLARDDVENLAAKFPGQPEKFKEAVAKQSSAFLGKLPEELRGDAAVTYNRIGQRRYFQAQEEFKAFKTDEIRATLMASAASVTNAAAKAARSGNIDEALEEIGGLAKTFGRAGPRETGGSGALSLVEIEKATQEARGQVQDSYLEGWAERTPNKRAALAGLRNGKTGDPWTDSVIGEADIDTVDRVAGHLETEIAKQDTEARVARNEWLSVKRDEVRFAADMLERGLPVEGLPKLRKEVAGTDLGKTLETVESTARFARSFALKSPAEQAVELEALQQTPQTPELYARTATAAKALQESIAAATPEVRFALGELEAGRKPEDLEGTLAKVAGTPLEEPLRRMVEGDTYAEAFGSQPIEQQAAELDALSKQPSTPDSAARLAAAGKVMKANVDALKDGRGLELAKDRGVVDLQPVNVLDPASMQARVSASLQASDYLGGNAGLLTPAERQAEVAKMRTMTGDQLPAYMAQLQQSSGDAYPDLIRELTTGKDALPRVAQYSAILANRPEAAPVLNAMVEGMQSDPKDLAGNLVRRGTTEAKVNAEVAARLEPWLGTVGQTYRQGSQGGGAAAMQADVTDMVKQTAMTLMRTYSMEESVKMAADGIINSRYEFRDGYRILLPASDKDAFLDRFDKAMSDTVASLSPELLDPPGSAAGVDERTRRQGYYDAVTTKGSWATLPDESGLVLTDELGNAVLAKGRPVVVKFGGRQ